MRNSAVVRDALWAGALAGVVGGLVFGAAMFQLGVLPTIASLVRARSAAAGFAVHMVIAAIVGAGFGMLVCRQRLSVGDMLLWGLIYGALWWFLGPLTLLPLLLGARFAWTVGAAQQAFPSLMGHLFYGAATALAFAAALRRGRMGHAVLWGTAARGALAGMTATWLLAPVVHAQGKSLEFLTAVPAGAAPNPGQHAVIAGMLAGSLFALLYPSSPDRVGPGLIRGTVYGFLWWIATVLTILPLLHGARLAWSVTAARASFVMLPGYLLWGAAVALVYQWLTALVRLLFSEEIVTRDQEGIGTQGLRVVGRGALAGLAGGLLFTIVMVRMGMLPLVASLVGSSSALTGFIVHLVIANLIGISYGLLFVRQSPDLGSGLGWGVSYGFFWWVLGPLTLMPMLLGAAPQWTIEVAAELLPSLIGHLAYGAGLGVTFHLLEARYNPWWIPHTQVEAERAARRREQVLTSAPALWALVVMIALVLPIVLTRNPL